MNIKDETLLKQEKKEYLSWELNPIKFAILDLFSHEFSEENYRQYTKDEVILLTQKKLKDIPNSEHVVKRLLKNMVSSKDVDDAILILGGFLSI